MVLGATGQLGSDICAVLSAQSAEFLPVDRSILDVRNLAAVKELVAAHSPAIVINATAFHNLSACEANPAEAFEVNATAVHNLADACTRGGSRLVHISTDYVFDGAKQTPYIVEDSVRPINVYGVSKAAGEFLVRNSSPSHLTVRTSGLFGKKGVSGKGGNFVETMLRLGSERSRVRVVNDQVLAPTHTADLAETVVRMAASDARGITHATNSGSCSWFEFAEAIFADSGLDHVVVEAVTTAEFGDPIPRPAYSVLDNQSRLVAGFAELRHWREALSAYLRAKRIL